MKTPTQVAIENIEGLLELDYKSNEYSDGYRKCVKDVVKYLKSQILEKEKEVMCEFAWEYERECRINLERSIEECWDKTFNTKEK